MNLRIIRKDDASDSHRTLAATGLSPPPKKNGEAHLAEWGVEHGIRLGGGVR